MKIMVFKQAAQRRTKRLEEQYSLGKILSIWAVATVPMALLAWVVAPLVIPRSALHPGVTYWLLMILGMMWQCVVSLFILYHELGTLRWQALRKRLWLNTPKDPQTQQPNARLFWWLVPCLAFAAAASLWLAPYVDAPLTWLLARFGVPQQPDISQLADPQFRGQWWLLGVALVSSAFNYVLGEELLFRGVLLPKMRGVFGAWDWVANAVLFGLYHLHKPWTLLSIVLSNLAISWPARRFRSNWMAVIIHGAESYFVLLVLAVILGLVP